MKVNFNEISFEQSNTDHSQSNGPRVSFFGLANDGDEAVVRIMHDSTDSFEILSTHPITLEGKFRKVNCLRATNEPFEKCPMCAAKMQQNQRIFIHLVKYDTDPQTGTIVATPMVWERSLAYARDLSSKINEYGPLSQVLFKIKRHGKKGDMTTTYSIDFANPAVYKPELYPVDPNVFEGYSALGTAVMNKTFEDMSTYVTTGSFPVNQQQQVAQTAPTYTAPTYQAPPVQQQYAAPVQQPQYAPPAQPQYAPPVAPTPGPETPPWEVNNQQPGVQRPVRYYN